MNIKLGQVIELHRMTVLLLLMVLMIMSCMFLLPGAA